MTPPTSGTGRVRIIDPAAERDAKTGECIMATESVRPLTSATAGDRPMSCVWCRDVIPSGQEGVSQISGVIFAHDQCLAGLPPVAEDPRRHLSIGGGLVR
jgi:hypothetical protein